MDPTQQPPQGQPQQSPLAALIAALMQQLQPSVQRTPEDQARSMGMDSLKNQMTNGPLTPYLMARQPEDARAISEAVPRQGLPGWSQR